MSAIATAIIGSAILGSSSSKSAAGAQAQASKDATAVQKEIADQQIALQREQYNQTRTDQAPFRQVGLEATNRLATLMGIARPVASGGGGGGGSFGVAGAIRNALINSNSFNGEVGVGGGDPSDPSFGSLTRQFTQADMNADPVYQNGLQFGLDQGVQGINRQAAAGGNFLSGATLKALTRFGNDYGSTKANESYNRFNNDQNSQYNRYAGLSGSGMQATNQVGAAGQNMTNGMSNALGTYGTGAANNSINAGNARASGYVGQANAVNNGLSSWLNYNQNQNMINAFGGNNGGYANMTGFQTPSAYTYPTTTSNYGALGTGTYGGY